MGYDDGFYFANLNEVNANFKIYGEKNRNYFNKLLNIIGKGVQTLYITICELV